MARESRGRRERREKHFRTGYESNLGISNSEGGWWPARDGDYSVQVLCPRCTKLFVIPSGLVMWVDFSFFREPEMLA